MIAAASAVALLIIMFLFDWFSVDLGADGLGVGVDVDTGANAWTAFGFIDIVLLITIIAAVGLAVMAANAQKADFPIAGSAVVAGLGILSVLLIIYRLIDPPGGGDIPDGFDISISRDIGVFLGLIASAGIAYGGFLAMQEEGTSFRDQGDRLQGNDPGNPPPAAGGPPPAV